MPQLHLRVKRKDCTIFLICDSSDSIRKLKGKVRFRQGTTEAAMNRSKV